MNEGWGRSRAHVTSLAGLNPLGGGQFGSTLISSLQSLRFRDLENSRPRLGDDSGGDVVRGLGHVGLVDLDGRALSSKAHVLERLVRGREDEVWVRGLVDGAPELFNRHMGDALQLLLNGDMEGVINLLMPAKEIILEQLGTRDDGDPGGGHAEGVGDLAEARGRIRQNILGNRQVPMVQLDQLLRLRGRAEGVRIGGGRCRHGGMSSLEGGLTGRIAEGN